MPIDLARADAGRREHTNVRPAPTRLSKLVVGAVVVVATWWLAGEVLLVLSAGVLAAIALNAATQFPGGSRVQRRGVALALVVLAIVVVVGVTGWLLAPEISAQTDELLQQLPNAWQSLLASLRRTEWGRALAHPPQVEESIAVVSNATGLLAIALHNVAFSSSSSSSASTSRRIRADRTTADCSGWSLRRRRRRAMEVAQVVEQALRRWLLSRFVAMGIVGSVTASASGF